MVDFFRIHKTSPPNIAKNLPKSLLKTKDTTVEEATGHASPCVAGQCDAWLNSRKKE